MNPFFKKIKNYFYQIAIIFQPKKLKIIWPEDKKLLQLGQMQLIDWNQMFYVKILVDNEFKGNFANANHFVADKNLFVSFSTDQIQYVFLLKDALIYFYDKFAQIKFCSFIQQFLAIEKDKQKNFIKKSLELKKAKNQLNKIKRNEILGLLPDEMLKKHVLIDEIKILKFMQQKLMYPYVKPNTNKQNFNNQQLKQGT